MSECGSGPLIAHRGAAVRSAPWGGRWGRGTASCSRRSAISNLGDGVGVIAYPWLASAITRNPLLIALVAVAQRLPWLRVHPAGRGHHRPPRPAPADGRRQRRPLRADGDRRRRRASPGRTSCRPRTSSTRSTAPRPAPLRRAPGRDPAARRRRGPVRQQRPDVPAGDRRRRAPRAGQRADVRRPRRRQPVHRPAARPRSCWPSASPCRSSSTPPPSPLSAGLVFLDRRGHAGPAAGASTDRQPWRTETAEGFRWLWHHPLLRTLAIVARRCSTCSAR